MQGIALIVVVKVVGFPIKGKSATPDAVGKTANGNPKKGLIVQITVKTPKTQQNIRFPALAPGQNKACPCRAKTRKA
jgi:hypothetical protein